MDTEFLWQKVNGRMQLANEAERLERMQYLSDVPEGVFVRETLTRAKKPTTHQQRKGFFGLLVKIAQEELTKAGHEVMGVPLTKDQTKRVIYHFCAPRDQDGQPITLSNHPLSSSARTVELIENTIRWLGTTFNCVVPDMDPAWREVANSSVH